MVKAYDMPKRHQGRSPDLISLIRKRTHKYRFDPFPIINC